MSSCAVFLGGSEVSFMKSLEINRKCLGGGTCAFLMLPFEVLRQGRSFPFLINKEKFQGTVRRAYVQPLLKGTGCVCLCVCVLDEGGMGGGWESECQSH